MTIIHWLKRALAGLGLTALAGCATTPPLDAAPAAPRPAMWKIADADTTIYLFGTIHLLPRGFKWRTPVLDQALARSDRLMIETLIDESKPQALIAELGRLGLRDGLPPILARVSPAKRPALSAAIAKSSIPAALFDRMETWAAAFSLLGAQFRSLGLDGGDGVETQLRRTFATAGKPIGELESNTQQLDLFDQLSEPAQRALLEGALEEPASARVLFDKMLTAWSSGNVEAIAKAFNEEMAVSSELLDALLAKRNARWAQWIEQRLAQPGTVTVAVGAGHLAGNRSVQRQLARRGIRAERVQ